MPNAFEEGSRKMIPAVLIYAFDKNRVLLIHRVPQGAERTKTDYHLGKWNGLGGKLEADESPLEAAQRELAEESGLHIPLERFKPLGTIQFPNFKAHKNEDWMVFVFRAEVTEQEARAVRYSSEEGNLHWIETEKFPELGFWPGDRHFLPHVLEGRPFMGAIWYEGQEVRRHWIHTL
jgi:8-oxo-dGTP diphosphatase